MARPTPSPAAAAMVLRPYALAHQPLELPLAALCLLALVVVFIGDITTPIQVAVSALGLIPLLAAVWFFSRPWALVVSAVGVVQLLLTGFLGTLSPITVASEATAYVVLAASCRLIAGSLSLLLQSGSGKPVGVNRPHPALFPKMRVRRGLSPMLLGLTNRERQVAQLAAEGYTAREIGHQLHIGKRTVETHLANAYEKLGVRSKRELMHSTAGAVSPTADA